jgi:hypothetical protein
LAIFSGSTKKEPSDVILIRTQKDNEKDNNMNIFNKKQANSIEVPDRVIIYKGELEYISRCILDYPDIETGGNLFGFYTTFRIPVIQYVLGPGKHSEHNPTHFRQDESFFNINADMLIKEHALHHIGTWHSHHKLGIDHPSGGDDSSIMYGMKEDGLESFLLVIGNIDKKCTTANAYYFSLPNRNYHHSRWVVLNEESPIRQQFDKKHRDVIHVPHTKNANMQQIDSVPLHGEVAKKISYSKGYWLNEEANKTELKIIVDYLKKRYKKVSFYQQEEDQTLRITIEDANNYEIVFPNVFPKVPPVIHCNGKIWTDSRWEKIGSISRLFLNYFERNSNNDR